MAASQAADRVARAAASASTQDPSSTQAAGGGGGDAASQDPAAAVLYGKTSWVERRKDAERARIRNRANRVTLKRAYRKGELPDVEIRLPDLLRPLRAVAMRDAGTARRVLAALVEAAASEARPAAASARGADPKLSDKGFRMAAAAAAEVQRITSASLAFAAGRPAYVAALQATLSSLLQFQPGLTQHGAAPSGGRGAPPQFGYAAANGGLGAAPEAAPPELPLGPLLATARASGQLAGAALALEKRLLLPEEPRGAKRKAPQAAAGEEGGSASASAEDRTSAAWRTLAEMFSLMGSPEAALALYARAFPGAAEAAAEGGSGAGGGGGESGEGQGGAAAAAAGGSSSDDSDDEGGGPTAHSCLMAGLSARMRGDVEAAESLFARALQKAAAAAAGAAGGGAGAAAPSAARASEAEVQLMQRERVGAMVALSRWGELPDPSSTAGRSRSMRDADGSEEEEEEESSDDEGKEGVLDFIHSIVHRAGVPFDKALLSHAAARDALLPAFVRAASRDAAVGEHRHVRDALEAVLRELSAAPSGGSGGDSSAGSAAAASAGLSSAREEAEGRFGLDAAVAAAAAGDADRARILLAAFGRHVRQRWAAAPRGATALQHAILASLQPAAELSEAIAAADTLQRSAAGSWAQCVRPLLDRWHHRWPAGSVSPAEAWEAVSAARRAGARLLQRRAPQQDQGAFAAETFIAAASLLRRSAAGLRRRGEVDLAFAAVTEGFGLLFPADAEGKAAVQAILRGAADEAAASAAVARERFLQDKERTKWILLKADRTPGPDAGVLTSVFKRRAWHEKNRGAWSAAGLARDCDALTARLSLRLARALDPHDPEVEGADPLTCAQQAAEAFGRACALADSEAQEAQQSRGSTLDPARAARRQAKAWAQFADFYHEVLLAARSSSTPAAAAAAALAAAEGGGGGTELNPHVAALFVERSRSGGGASVAARAVECTFRALACGGGGGGGRTALLRVLALLSGDSADARGAFASLSGSVPAWLFLPWAQQMLSFIAGAEGDALYPVLRRLRQEYPRALDYPLLLAREVTHAPAEAKERVEKLLALNRSQVTERFARAVEDLTATGPRLSAWNDRCTGLRNATKEEVAAVLALLLSDLSPTEAEAEERVLPKGKYFRGRVADAPIRKAVEKALRDEVAAAAAGAAVRPRQALERVSEAVREALREYQTKAVEKQGNAALTLQNVEQNMKNRTVRLRDYCGWFDTFTRSPRRPEELEVPGQFDGGAADGGGGGGSGGPPRADLHLRVSGFAEEGKVMNSKQLPKVLVVSRSDGTEARFLAKGGEDLRQDERILRLFRLMGALFASDPACAARGLALRTYSVVPLSSRAGRVAAPRSSLSDVLLHS